MSQSPRRTVQIKDIGRVVTGSTPSTKRPEYFGSDYLFIKPSDITPGTHRVFSTEVGLSPAGSEVQKKRLLPRNSTCVVCIGTIGKICLTGAPSFTNQQINSVVVDTDCYDPLYVYYLLTMAIPKMRKLEGGSASGREHVRKSLFEQIELEVHSLPIQRKIAFILSAYDDLIENNTHRIAILEEIAQNLYREWFVHFRFPGHEQTAMLDSELEPIPQGWEVIAVSAIVKRYRTGKKYNTKTVVSEGKVPVLDQGRSGIIGYHNDEPGFVAGEDNPVIVFANHTCYQRTVLFPFSAIQNVIPFRATPGRHRDIYWLHWATKDLIEFNDYKGHWPEFMTKRLPLPPAKLCAAFGDCVRSMVLLSHRLEQRNSVLRRTRDLLLPRLISGQIDVSDLPIDVSRLDLDVGGLDP